MERNFFLALLSMTLVATLSRAQVDPLNIKVHDHGFAEELRPSEVLLRLRRDSGDGNEGTELCSAQRLNDVTQQEKQCERTAEIPADEVLML